LIEVLLPLCHLQMSELWQRAWGLALWFRHAGMAGGETRVILDAGAASQVTLPWLTAQILAVIAAVYVCSLLYFAGRLGWGVWKTDAMRRRAESLALTQQTVLKVNRLGRFPGTGTSAVLFASTSAITGPATVGVVQQTLLLPPRFLDKLGANDLDALLAHEFAHMSRLDFAKNLLYGIISLPVTYHPLLALTRARLAETRELVCDAMAAEAIGGREIYARSLLRLASMLSDRPARRVLHAIGIFDANIFERRVMNLTRRGLEIKGTRRLAILAGCGVIAFATCASALALRMDVAEPSEQGTAPVKLHVKVGDLTIASKVQPGYPAEAKKDRLSGTVTLTAIIGKDGAVENIKVTKSLRADCDQSAIDAVKQWRYQPYLLNGEPTEVETTIHIIYTLAR
jgi:TonB family protein